ncbi:hypothetical protein [Actinoallomurus sp. NPDC052274]|uniref:hypothetical protein n=1 Tax=Actinoallomurus sp. NPDC052274 TaxID=3155420 RepID=UPI0034477A62
MSTPQPYHRGREAPAEPVTRVDSAVLAAARPYEAGTGSWLARLRAEFPRWGILFDPWRSTWVAVRGRRDIEVAPTAIALQDALAARDFVPAR